MTINSFGKILAIVLVLFAFGAKGQIIINTNMGVNANLPIDTRFVLTNLSDTSSVTWEYNGLLTYVLSDSSYWYYQDTWQAFSVSDVITADSTGGQFVIVSLGTGSQDTIHVMKSATVTDYGTAGLVPRSPPSADTLFLSNKEGWIALSDLPGDGWGADTVVTDNTLTGPGITGSPLRVDTNEIATQYDISQIVDQVDTTVVADQTTILGDGTAIDSLRVNPLIIPDSLIYPSQASIIPINAYIGQQFFVQTSRGLAEYKTQLTSFVSVDTLITIPLSNGFYAVYQPSIRGINVVALGATPNDSGDDDLAAFQKAFNYAINSGTVSTIYVPAGEFRISDPYYWKKSDNGFLSINMVGEGDTYASTTGSGQTSSIIRSTFTDGFVFGISKGKGCTVENITFVNNATGPNIGSYLFQEWAESTMKAGSGHRYDRYSPSSCVVIDPFAQAVTPDGGYPGLSAEYDLPSNQGSTAITFRNCYFYGGIVGVMVNPTDDVQNSEDILIDNCKAEFMMDAVAVGQSQSRAVRIQNLHASSVRRYLNIEDYGVGSAPFPVFDGSIGSYVYELFKCGQSNTAANGVFDNMFVEQLYRLGDFREESVAYQESYRYPHVTISGSYLRFRPYTIDANGGNNGLCSNLSTGSSMTIQSSYLETMNETLPLVFDLKYNLTIIGCKRDAPIVNTDMGVLSIIEAGENTLNRFTERGTTKKFIHISDHFRHSRDDLNTTETMIRPQSNHLSFWPTETQTVTFDTTNFTATFKSDNPLWYFEGDWLFANTSTPLGVISNIAGDSTITLDRTYVGPTTGSTQLRVLNRKTIDLPAFGKTTSGAYQIDSLGYDHSQTDPQPFYPRELFEPGYVIYMPGAYPNGTRARNLAGDNNQHRLLVSDPAATTLTDYTYVYNSPTQRVAYSDGIPDDQVWITGDFVWNTSVSSTDSIVGWVCSQTGVYQWALSPSRSEPQWEPVYLGRDGYISVKSDSTLTGEGRNDNLLSVDLHNQFTTPAFYGVQDSTLTIDVTSNGTTATLSYTTGDGWAKFLFSDSVHLIADQSVTLTQGTDGKPAHNYVYIDAADDVLKTSTAGWPGIPYSPIATVVVPTAATAQARGFNKVHVWTDHLSNSVTGHIEHLNFWIRNQPATWKTGVDWVTNGTGQMPADSLYLTTAGGTALQLHLHGYPAFNDTTQFDYIVYNALADSIQAEINTLDEITDIADGTPIANNNRYSLVFWGVVSEDNEDCQIFINKPLGVYTSTEEVIADASNLASYTIPNEYVGTGFLIAELKLQYRSTPTPSWEVVDSIDLRSPIPGGGAPGGTGAPVTVFADGEFRVYDTGDPSKQVALELSGVSPATTRVLTVPDQDGTIALTSDLVQDTVTLLVQDSIMVYYEDGIEVGRDTVRIGGTVIASKILWVSPNGNNSTATKGNPTLPWADPWQARSDASSGDLIYILPGDYTSTGSTLYKEGVNYFAAKGVNISISTSHRFMSQFSSAPGGCNFYGHAKVEMTSGSLKFLDISAVGAEINGYVELDTLIIDHSQQSISVIAAQNKWVINLGVVIDSADHLLVNSSVGAPPSDNLFDLTIDELYLLADRGTGIDAMSINHGQRSKTRVNIGELYFTGSNATGGVIRYDVTGAGSIDSIDMELNFGKVRGTSTNGYDLFRYNPGNATVTNSRLVVHCDDCLDLGASALLLNFGSGAGSSSSTATISGSWRAPSSAGNAFFFGGTPTHVVTLDNLTIENNGVAAPIGAPSAYTINVSSAFDMNTLVLDSDITYNRLDEYGLSEVIAAAVADSTLAKADQSLTGDRSILNDTSILTIQGSDQAMLTVQRDVGGVAGLYTLAEFRASQTSLAAIDGYGVGFNFSIEDDGGTNLLGRIGYVRDGADNSGAFEVAPKTAGVTNTRFRLDNAGQATWGGYDGGTFLESGSDTSIYILGINASEEMQLIDKDALWNGGGGGGGDNLGNHIMTQNLQTNGEWISNDGGDEAIFIEAEGSVAINTATPDDGQIFTIATVAGQLKVDSSSASIEVERAGGGAFFSGSGANGTKGSETASTVDNSLFTFQAKGHNGTSFTTGTARINFKAAETYTGSAQGSYITLETTPVTTTTRQEVMRLKENADIDFPNAALVELGNIPFDADQTIGAGQDNMVMTYDFASNRVRLESAAGGGNVSNTGTPLNNQLAVWTDATTIEGDANLTWDGNVLSLGTGKAISSGTSATNTLLLQAYDVDGTSYTTFGTLTSNNTPTFDLASSVTIGSNAIAYSGGAFHNGFSDFVADEHRDATTDDWAGTFDSQEGSWYRERTNHTGTQLLSTISDVTATAAELNVLDLSATALTTGWVYAADGASAASWRQLLGSEINNDQGWTSNTGDVTTIGTPLDNQVAVWTGDGTIEGTTGLTYNGTTFDVTGNITLSGTVDGIDIATDVAANTAKVTNQTHTGDATGSTVLTISNDAVTYAKMQNVVNDDRLLGNVAGAGQPVAELDAATVKTMLSLSNVENTALSTWAGSSNITTLGTVTTGVWNGTDVAIADGGTGAGTASAAFDNLKQAATTSATGVVELATQAEVNTGTDANRAITPSTLEGSDLSTQVDKNTTQWYDQAITTATTTVTLTSDRPNGVIRMSNTGNTATTLTINNETTTEASVYTFYIYGLSAATNITFPSNFDDLNGSALVVSVSTSALVTCIDFDGTGAGTDYRCAVAKPE